MPARSAAASRARSSIFDPQHYIERKEIKKMARFIQFAVTATQFALANPASR